MSNAIEEIKQRMSIPDLLGRWGIQVKGGNSLIKSPLRDDKHPSFSIYDNGRRWKDHSTGESGDVIDLIEAKMNCNTADAINMLAGELGIDNAMAKSKAGDLPRRPEPPKVRSVEDNETPWKYDEDALQYMDDCKGRLWKFLDSGNETAQCMELLIGTKGFTHKELATMFAKRGLQLGADREGKLVYFMPYGVKVRTGRTSRGDRWLHGKAKHNLFLPVLYPDRTDSIIFTEGETDALTASMSFQLEAQEMPMILGVQGVSTLPSPKILYPYLRGKPRVVVAFDNDEAGMSGSIRFRKYLQQELNVPFHTIHPVNHTYNDLGVLFQKEGPGAVTTLLT